MILVSLYHLGPRDLTSDGVKVNCNSDFMDVSLSRLVYPWLDPGLLRISLIQSTCTAYTITDLEVTIQAPLGRCGSKTNLQNKYTLRSRNTVITQPRRPEGVLITYLPEIHFPFTCDYEITHAQGKTSLKPIGEDKFSDSILAKKTNLQFDKFETLVVYQFQTDSGKSGLK